MKIWAKVIKNQKIQSDVVQVFSLARPCDISGWAPILHDLCQSLDLARPVMLNKHLQELDHFNRTAFRPSDFMETVLFDRFEVELFPEENMNTMEFPFAY